MDGEEVVEPAEKYELRMWMEGGEPAWRYWEEHWFTERPETGIILMLFEEAKRTYAALYPGREPEDFSVGVTRLRPTDDYRPTSAVWLSRSGSPAFS